MMLREANRVNEAARDRALAALRRRPDRLGSNDLVYRPPIVSIVARKVRTEGPTRRQGGDERAG